MIWEWHALGHVPVKDSYLPYVLGQGYDYFHLNSIQQLPDGNILISSRNTWAVYLINKKTGKIIWRLGGKHSSFKMGAHTNFEWQHDATLQKGGLLTLFDDANNPKEESQSRALKLHISTKKHRVTLVHQYVHSPPTLASSQGSTQILSNGNVFVGWGSKPYFSEYSSRGKQLFGGSFVAPVASYRAYRFNWVGNPLQPPVDRGQTRHDGGRGQRICKLERLHPGEEVAGALLLEQRRTVRPGRLARSVVELRDQDPRTEGQLLQSRSAQLQRNASWRPRPLPQDGK